MGPLDRVIVTDAGPLVERPRLLDRFGAFERGVRVIGIWAPVGSGKPALLRQWMSSTEAPVHVADAGDEAEVVDTITRLEAEASGRVYLAIDGMERATPRVRDAIVRVIDTATPVVRVVLAGRFDPLPASPARWVLTEEIREEDLAFTAEEAGRFFDGLASPPSESQFTGVLERTRGPALHRP